MDREIVGPSEDGRRHTVSGSQLPDEPLPANETVTIEIGDATKKYSSFRMKKSTALLFPC